MALRFVISLIFAFIVALFAILNSGTVELNCIFATYSVSQALVILISAILGSIIVLLLSFLKQYRLNKTIKGLSAELKKVQEENKGLKIVNEELNSKLNEKTENKQEQYKVLEVEEKQNPVVKE